MLRRVSMFAVSPFGFERAFLLASSEAETQHESAETIDRDCWRIRSFAGQLGVSCFVDEKLHAWGQHGAANG